jgi:hypothetical protein
MSDTIIFAVGTVVSIAVATATFIWGYLQFDALRVGDDGDTERADAERLHPEIPLGGDGSIA